MYLVGDKLFRGLVLLTSLLFLSCSSIEVADSRSQIRQEVLRDVGAYLNKTCSTYPYELQLKVKGKIKKFKCIPNGRYDSI
mgnify:CR=1 FL=1